MIDPGLDGRGALVVGGGTGIGAAISLALARYGTRVTMASRRPPNTTAIAIEQSGGWCRTIELDASDEASVVAGVREARRQMGSVDILVYAAAITAHEPVTRLTHASWTDTLATNLTGAALVAREVARLMIPQSSGSMLFVGSTAAHNPLYKEAAYRSAKAGLKALVEVLAIELAPFGIRVNLLTPGGVETALLRESSPRFRRVILEIPLRRLARPDELAGSAVHLLSDALSPYTTGSELVVDGGLSLRPVPAFRQSEITKMNRVARGSNPR